MSHPVHVRTLKMSFTKTRVTEPPCIPHQLLTSALVEALPVPSPVPPAISVRSLVHLAAVVLRDKVAALAAGVGDRGAVLPRLPVPVTHTSSALWPFRGIIETRRLWGARI